MIKKDDAKPRVIREWDSWAVANLRPNQEASGTHGLTFFAYLQSERPDLLAFKTRGDPWQTIHSWLLQEGKVTD